MNPVFWQDEIRDFPEIPGPSRLWLARNRGEAKAPILEIVFEMSRRDGRLSVGDITRPPLSRMYRTAQDGAPRRRDDPRPGGPSAAVLRVEPMHREGRVIGVCALESREPRAWGETLDHWLLRFVRRVAAYLDLLPAMPERGFAERPCDIPELFPRSAGEGHARAGGIHRPARPVEVGYPLPCAAHIPEVPDIIGVSREMRDCCRALRSAAASPVNILLQGDSGTGKELLARAVHNCSSRRDQPFVGLNCAALPESLFESELFGHKAGAFTGAGKEKIGLLEAANRGTFFLDEIGDMPLQLQIKLLRVMQEKSLRRIGDLNSRPVDLRFVSASHKNLEREIDAGRFRLDLYYRLKVVRIDIPPLFRRPEDIPHLLSHFLKARGRDLGRTHLAQTALEAMQAYRWPGNVRELENEISRWCALHPQRGMIRLEDLSMEIGKALGHCVDPADLGTLRSMNEATEILERYLIRKAIGACGGRKADAARRLGLSRQGLYKKIKRYGMGDLLQVR